MTRDLARLAAGPFDALVVGGGIYGVAIAWDAARRGLAVALVDKGDFGHATSASTLRVIHGGLRYLQRADLRRLRASIRERHTFLRIAPHLVHPLPFLIPTYGHGARGRAAFRAALLVNDLMTVGRRRLGDPARDLPRSRVISRDECLRLCPGLYRRGLTGAAIVYDGQMSSSERLLLSVAQAAGEAGAQLANHVEVTGPLPGGGGLAGVTAVDRLTGDELDIRARVVVNTSGPWLEPVLGAVTGGRSGAGLRFAKAFNLLVDRPLATTHAIGIYSREGAADPGPPMGPGSRLYFATPWQGRSLIGTAHLPDAPDPDRVEVTEAEVQAFLDEVNRAHPTAALERRDVCRVYAGLLPVTGSPGGAAGLGLLTRYRIRDHEAEGVRGLVSVAGVKFTEARAVAEKAVDLVFRKLGRAAPPCTTAHTPVYGGAIERLDAFLARETERSLPRHGSAVVPLIERYGTAYPEVLACLDDATPPGALEAPDRLLRAEILHGIRAEMARTLGDVVFRRTALGAAGAPDDGCLEGCAAVVAAELGWPPGRMRREIEEVKAAFAAGRGVAMR